jgi:hypothetical protein
MRIQRNYITALVAAGAAAFAIAAAPMAAAAPTGTTNATGSTVHQITGDAQITAKPGAAAQQAAQYAATIRRGYGRPVIPPLREQERGRTALRTTVHSGREVLSPG